MANKQQDIDDLFSIFHDFEIVEAELDNEVLTMGIIIPWGQMWDENDYKIKVELTGCRNFECVYYEIISDKMIRIGERRLKSDSEKKITKDPMDLKDLKLSVQYTTYNPPDTYILHCDSIQDIDFATLTLTAADYQLYDKYGQPMEFDRMKQWGTDWWDSIRKMWDEQKNKK